MASRADEYLRMAKACDEKAQAADHDDISNNFRKLAHQWRMLAEIAIRQTQPVDGLVNHLDVDSRRKGLRGRNPSR